MRTVRTVVNVAVGGRFAIGQRRMATFDWQSDVLRLFPEYPVGCPTHQELPFAFKAYALKDDLGFRRNDPVTLLWADSCIVPHKDLTPLWEQIERDGYWISNNGFSNAEWTVPEAYEYLGVTREDNEKIPHVVATTFGISLAHPVGRAILDEYMRLAMNGSFRGPVRILPGTRSTRHDMAVSGHRHDQTALSVIAWRLGCKLTNPPAYFAYRGGETDETYLVADGDY